MDGDGVTPVRVPPHGSIQVPWAFRRALWGVDAYEASVPARIAEIDVRIDAATAERVRETTRAIVEAETYSGHSLAVLEPFLLRTEAIASSRIEEEITTVDQLARAESGLKVSAKTRQVYASLTALRKLVDRASSGALSLDDILDAHRGLMEPDVTERHLAGQLRDQQNWIGGAAGHPVGAAHVPPPAALAPELMDDLVQTMKRTDLDPLVQASLVHAQFESIHPFTDGNGRIGRVLINATLRYRNVTRWFVVPVAAVLAARRERYFASLDVYREGDLGPALTELTYALAEASRQAMVAADNLRRLPGEWREIVRPRSGSAADTLIDTLVQHPIMDIDQAVTQAQASVAATYRALEQLEEVGILRRASESARNRLWVAGAVLDEADALIDRAHAAN